MRHLTVLLLMATAGCSLPEPRSDSGVAAPAMGKPMAYRRAWSNQGIAMPAWYTDPCQGGRVLGAWGSAPMDSSKTLGERRDLAADQARAQIACSRKVRVQALTRDFEGADDLGALADRNRAARVIAEGSVEGAVVRELWEHPETGELLVWVVVDTTMRGDR